ncbi:hypothetical protein EYF80_036988 [Liparis tanakae]|uniref:Uncharacterized protein n=1 Tax=Liparis tanakae TaxID=230148 RepID=A0A4Z2GJ48_9TELE|nr:hypothetical protein EYF80_036988 [Liparis tanakae]
MPSKFRQELHQLHAAQGVHRLCEAAVLLELDVSLKVQMAPKTECVEVLVQHLLPRMKSIVLFEIRRAENCSGATMAFILSITSQFEMLLPGSLSCGRATLMVILAMGLRYRLCSEEKHTASVVSWTMVVIVADMRGSCGRVQETMKTETLWMIWARCRPRCSRAFSRLRDDFLCIPPLVLSVTTLSSAAPAGGFRSRSGFRLPWRTLGNLHLRTLPLLVFSLSDSAPGDVTTPSPCRSAASSGDRYSVVLGEDQQLGEQLCFALLGRPVEAGEAGDKVSLGHQARFHSEQGLQAFPQAI